MQHMLTSVTEALGEGKTSEGKWVGILGSRGMQRRCALTAVNARGKVPNPHHPSASGVVQCTRVHQTRLDERLAREHLAYCYY